MTDQDKQKKIEAALQESAKVEQTLIMAAPILMDILGVGSFSLPIPGTDPVQYVAAGTLAEIERATRKQDALQQIAEFGQEQDAAPKLFPSAPLKLYAFTEDGMEIDNAHGHWYKKDDVERLLASLAPVAAEPRDLNQRIDAFLDAHLPPLARSGAVAAEPVRQVLLSQRESFERWFSDEGKWPRAVDRSGEGYRLAHAQSAWQAWKACYAALDITGRPSGAPVHDAPQVPTAAEVPSQWISVEDHLPSSETDVLIILFGQIRLGAIFIEHESYEEGGREIHYWDDPNDDGQIWDWCDVTHWMPLPAAPSVEVKGEQGEMGGDRD